MGDEGGDNGVLLMGYGNSSEGFQQINSAIASAWEEVLGDPAALAEIARTLRLSAEETAAKLPQSPFWVKPAQTELGTIEIAIVAFVSTVAYELAKEAAKEGARALVLWLWENFVKPRAEDKLSARSIGAEFRLA
jgi:hypothetical protein